MGLFSLLDIHLVSMYDDTDGMAYSLSSYLKEYRMGRDLPRGDVPTLILAVLSEHPAHGYAIARAIEDKSSQVLNLREGSLYPALRVLEQQQLIVSAWDVSARGPARKVYTLTDAGREALARRTAEWDTYTTAIAAVLGKRRVSYG
jgi:PadR family transcriptional regulator, regulatory protein PadR